MALTNGQSGSGQRAEINVTPLIDVLLVLLIIFMVITPAASRGLGAAIPQPASEARATAPESPIVVQVAAGLGGKLGYRLNGAVVERGELRARLERVMAGRLDRTMFVEGEAALQFDDVAEVIDEGHRAGVNNIGLLTGRQRASQAEK